MTASPLDAFVAEVGDTGPVAVVGARTAWDVGGPLDEGTRLVTAPGGVRSFNRAEMVVEVGAGLSCADLDALLGEAGQEVILDPPGPNATVGGVLAVGRSGVRRLRHGPLRDVVLRLRFVDGAGRLVTAGGGTVKNVAGYDLCRLLVGSLGTLGLLGEVLLRTRPRPEVTRWYRGPMSPRWVQETLYRPSSILWDGSTTWVLLEGYGEDVDAEGSRLVAEGASPVTSPPDRPANRWSMAPASLASLAGRPGRFVAEIGVGVVHHERSAPLRSVDPSVVELHDRIRRALDPAGRLNPGRDALAGHGGH